MVPMWKNAPRLARGYYAWKPVAVKQMAEMFPYFLCIDAGALVLRSPAPLFEYIREHGHFFMHKGDGTIKDYITRPQVEKIVKKLPLNDQHTIMSSDAYCILSGLIGLSKKFYTSLIEPIYKMTSDITLFEDDGSSKYGYGWIAYEQIHFSIFKHVLKLESHQMPGWISLKIGKKEVPLYLHWEIDKIIPETTIYHSQRSTALFGEKSAHARYLNPAGPKKNK